MAPTEILVSPLDSRSYRHFVTDNGISVLLVRDPDADKAAAAMDVGVGHFSDPEEFPGLAHFLEHMLFLGTEKFPDEAEFTKFLAEHGGDSNAYTNMENTNYHFNVLNDALPDALDRFAQFFVAPRMDASAAAREVLAVHSENQKNLQSDVFRAFQLHKTLADPRHPYHKFGTGSSATLGDGDGAVRDALLAFHGRYYSANVMRLCIVANHPLERLEQWARELFAPVRNKAIPSPAEEYAAVEPFPAECLCKIVRAAPIKDVRTLRIVWMIPPYHASYRSKPGNFLSHLVGHEGKGSLLSLLKDRHWADSLSAGSSWSTVHSNFFEVSVDLTVEGLERVDEIVEMVFAYLRVVEKAGIAEWVYDEVKAVGDMSFRFREREETISLASRLAADMAQMPPEHILAFWELYFEFKPELVRGTLALLSPQRALVVIYSKSFENGDAAGSAQENGTGPQNGNASVVLDRTEKWYGTKYSVEEFGAERLRRWSNPDIPSDFAIPAKNAFIATDFSILPAPLGAGPGSVPELIKEGEGWRLHHLQDTEFNRPKVNMFFEMRSPVAYYSPRHAIMANLFTGLLVDELTEFAYDAEVAGLNYELNNTMAGIQLTVGGYSHKIKILLEAIVEKIASFTVNEQRFEMIRELTERDYMDTLKDQPYQTAVYAVSHALEEPRWHIQEYIPEVKTATAAEVNAFAASFRESMQIEGLIHGNISRDAALETAAMVSRTLGFRPLPDSRVVRRRIVELPTGNAGLVLPLAHTNPDDGNSCVEVLYQVGALNVEEKVVLELLCEIMEKPCYHRLRTVEQLGYIVWSGMARNGSIYGLRFILQSTVMSPAKLEERIEAFLTELATDILPAQPAKEFTDFVDSLVTLKLEKVKSLGRQSERFWSEISREDYLYNRFPLEAAALRRVSQPEVAAFLVAHILPAAPQRRKLAVLVHGNAHGAELKEVSGLEKTEAGAVVVRDALALRRTRPLLAQGRGEEGWSGVDGKDEGKKKMSAL